MLSNSRIIDRSRIHCYPEVMEIDYNQHVATFDTSLLELCKEAKESRKIPVKHVETVSNQFNYDDSMLTSEQKRTLLDNVRQCTIKTRTRIRSTIRGKFAVPVCFGNRLARGSCHAQSREVEARLCRARVFSQWHPKKRVNFGKTYPEQHTSLARDEGLLCSEDQAI